MYKHKYICKQQLIEMDQSCNSIHNKPPGLLQYANFFVIENFLTYVNIENLSGGKREE